VPFRFVLTKLLAAFAISFAITIAGSVGWTLAAAVGDPAAARLLGWLALSVLVLTGLLGAALLATMTLWMLAEHPQDETRSPSSAPRPASEATPATSSQEEARNERGSRP
jgi:hypothetical protein